MIAFQINNLSKIYGTGDAKVVALDNIHLTIPKNQFIVILGESGSGKSTLLNMIGCMDKPSSGKILFEEQDLTKLSKAQMTEFRKNKIGFVFQSYNLLPDLSALENVEFSTELVSKSREDAENALIAVGLKERISHFPGELSGGEQQRVSIARAIAKRPEILLCDEPTGALDFETGIKILEVLKDIQTATENTVIFITHNKEIAKIADIVIQLRSGKIMSVEENLSPLAPKEVEW
ncbi:ABC transporter ATP-binding protein [Enterococcus raffinosus]|uniref:ABC transporter ATP-binding protein n=1 Tax=Enterococcus raffinosus TaxID=71452 RepID=UPI001C100136|nr:ABC transporter ATP-binding protein [Enterococcus raffinosus]MBU5363361.1 ABC transporter ATP-binding protein [Enterococcus raffinosus]